MNNKEIEIKKLKFPENYRGNVGMYLGSTSDFTTPLREIINNSTDEVLNNYANSVVIENHTNYKIVMDTGRGLPFFVDPDNPDAVITEELLTGSHVGSKFDNENEKTGGLHGIGSKAVNAVSARYVVIVNSAKKDVTTTLQSLQDTASTLSKPVFVLEYKLGIKTEMTMLEFDSINSFLGIDISIPDNFGTLVYIEPDTTLYQSGKSYVSHLPLSVAKLYNKDSSIVVNGTEVAEFDMKSQFDSNILHDRIFETDIVLYDGKLDIKLFFGFSKDKFNYEHRSMLNLIENHYGGFLERNITTGIGTALSWYEPALTSNDVRYGLRQMSISFSSFKMFFSSQTKEKLDKLGDINRTDLINSIAYHVYEIIKSNPEYFSEVCNRIVELKKTMNQLSNKAYVESKVKIGGSGRWVIPHGVKIWKSRSHDASQREFYLTEGDSATGNIAKFRNEFQTVLALTGKITNTSASDLTQLLEDDHILTLINEIGAGVDGFSDITQLRYRDVIIAVDPDEDGNHIANLIVAVFLKHLPDVLKAGVVKRLVLPFYRVTNRSGTNYYYVWEKDKIDFNSSTVKKLKGLGSLTPAEAKRFLIGPERRLITVTAEDATEISDALSLLRSGRKRQELMIEGGYYDPTVRGLVISDNLDSGDE